MSAADQLRRLLQLIPELADDEYHAIDDVARRLGVDRKVLVADLRTLSERFDDPAGFTEGVGIEIDRERVHVRADHFKRPLRLTLAEVGALELGLAMLRSTRPREQHAAIERARDRLRKFAEGLPPDSALPVRVAEFTGTGTGSILQEVRAAMKERHKLRITYRSGSSAEVSDRTVCPYACVHSSGMWYIVGHCERSSGLRVFRLDRIDQASTVDERYDVPEGFDAAATLAEGKVLLPGITEKATVRYSPRVARWIAEREGKPLAADGSLTLDHPLGDPGWLVRHVLQYGPDAEVLSPEAGRAAVAEVLEEL